MKTLDNVSQDELTLLVDLLDYADAGDRFGFHFTAELLGNLWGLVSPEPTSALRPSYIRGLTELAWGVAEMKKPVVVLEALFNYLSMWDKITFNDEEV